MLGIGVGAFLMYEAWRNPSPTPVAKAKALLASVSGGPAAFSAPLTGSAAIGTIVQTPTGPVKVH